MTLIVNQFPSHTAKETCVRNVTDFLMTLIVLCNGLSTLTTMFKMVEQEYDFLFVLIEFLRFKYKLFVIPVLDPQAPSTRKRL